jgi:hypothetical protein
VFEIEFSQAAPAQIARSARGKLGGEGAGPFDASRERRFVGEQEVRDERLARALNAAGRAVKAFVSGSPQRAGPRRVAGLSRTGGRVAFAARSRAMRVPCVIRQMRALSAQSIPWYPSTGRFLTDETH